MATNLQVFLREKISDLNTPDTFFEYTTDYDIKSYAKRQLYLTGSYSTTLATFGTQSQGDFETMVYGRISNIDTYTIDVKLVNEDDDLAIFTLGAGEHLMLPNQNFSDQVGNTETLKRIEAKVASGSSRKIKVEYFFASENEDI
jgi:hypothetical protein